MSNETQADLLTQRAHRLITESARLGRSMPPWWKRAERARINEHRAQLQTEASRLVERARKIVGAP